MRHLDSSLVRSNANHWLNASAQNRVPVPESGDSLASAIPIASGQCSEVDRPDCDANDKALIAVTENINHLQKLVSEKSAKISAIYANGVVSEVRSMQAKPLCSERHIGVPHRFCMWGRTYMLDRESPQKRAAASAKAYLKASKIKPQQHMI